MFRAGLAGSATVCVRPSHLEIGWRSADESAQEAQVDTMPDTPQVARRRHNEDLKKAVLAECQQPGASVARIALSHGLKREPGAQMASPGTTAGMRVGGGTDDKLHPAGHGSSRARRRSAHRTSTGAVGGDRELATICHD